MLSTKQLGLLDYFTHGLQIQSFRRLNHSAMLSDVGQTGLRFIHMMQKSPLGEESVPLVLEEHQATPPKAHFA